MCTSGEHALRLVDEKLLEPTGGLLTWSFQALPTNKNMTVIKEKDESASINHTCKET